MRKFILRCGAAFLTFTIGLAINFFINGVVERWIETPEPVLEEPCASVLAAQQRLMPSPRVRNCGLLVVKVSNDRSITLGSEERGSLNNTSSLVARLNELFKGRADAHAYRPGFELNLDVPEEERIEKTVLIKAPRSISYGDVTDLIDVISATGAKPIGLVTERSLAIQISGRTTGLSGPQAQETVCQY